MNRVSDYQRTTSETSIQVSMNLDGSGLSEVTTGLPFFDHMLELMFRHALFDFGISVQGDLEVDGHHTVEDTGIAIGKALSDALGDKKGITRFASLAVPMDESLAEVVMDISGRPYLAWDVSLEPEPLGNFDPELARDFFQSLVNESRITLHIGLRKAGGNHHSLEAIFKAFGRALKQAVSIDPRVTGVPSTKGML